VADQLRLVADPAGLLGTRLVVGPLAVPPMLGAFLAAARDGAGAAVRAREAGLGRS